MIENGCGYELTTKHREARERISNSTNKNRTDVSYKIQEATLVVPV